MNEHDIINIISERLSEHQIHFSVESKIENSKYICDLYLPQGLGNTKLLLGEKYIKIDINGPTVIELKRRLLFDTISRYEDLYINELKKVVSSFLLIYMDEKLPYIEKKTLQVKHENGFHVLSLRQFLDLIPEKGNPNSLSIIPYDWKTDRDKTLEIAQSNILDNNFSLFLGAGVSMSAKLPSWWSLLDGMMNESKNKQFAENDIEEITKICYNSSIVMGRFIRLMQERKSNEESYYTCLHNALYAGKDSCNSKLIEEICGLISRRRHQAKSIITYNFDDVMERALAAQGIDNYPIFGMNQPRNRFPIYHVHGFIPYNNSEIIKSIPVLSEEEYHKVYANSYNWSNVEQIHALSRTMCIFIGLSMTDPNLRRLLDIAIRDSENDARHFVFLPHIEIFNDEKYAEEKNNEAMRIQKEIFLELGLRVIWYDNYDELPALVGMLK